jgi:hypothetical protein
MISMSRECAVALIAPLLAAAGPTFGAGEPAPGPARQVVSASASPTTGTGLACRSAVGSLRPPLYRIDLKATGRVVGARGTAILQPASTLFGVSVTPDGHHLFAVTVSARGLPAPSSLGPYSTYVAWAARADLSHVDRLGRLDADGKTAGHVAFEKFLVFITAEDSGDAQEQRGPILLQGLSPSGQMKNMLTEPLLNGGMPPC